MPTLILTLGGAFTDTSLPVITRDEVIVPATLCCYDLARSYSWPGGAPVNGSVVKDLTNFARDASMVIAGGSVAYAGGGFDFEGATDANAAMLKIPTSVLAALWGTPQYWLACAYLRLPTFADWVVRAINATFVDTAGAGSLNSHPSLFAIAQQPGFLTGLRRQTSSYAAISVAAANLGPFYGTVCQVAMWRNAAGIGLRVKNGSGSQAAATAAGVTNDLDFSAAYGSAGIPEAALLRPLGNEQKFRLYRLFIEDLNLSGRVPATVLDDDWTRTAARGVFS